jgi:hypothetical protein
MAAGAGTTPAATAGQQVIWKRRVQVKHYVRRYMRGRRLVSPVCLDATMESVRGGVGGRWAGAEAGLTGADCLEHLRAVNPTARCACTW